MSRRLFTFFAAFSLLIAVAVGVLWVRLQRGAIADEFTAILPGTQVRYTFRSADGRLSLLRPPPSPPSPGAAVAAEAVAGIENSQLVWEVARREDGSYRPDLSPLERTATAARLARGHG